jgi:hypothetical protein
MPATLLFDYPALENLADYLLERVFDAGNARAPASVAVSNPLDGLLDDIDAVAGKSDAELASYLTSP